MPKMMEAIAKHIKEEILNKLFREVEYKLC